MPKEFEIEYQRLLTATSLLSIVEDSDYTKNHSLRVGHLIKEMCDIYNELNNIKIDSYDRKILIRAAYFHDIGKIKLPKNILFKVGKLTNDEYEEMKKHPKYGYDILNELKLTNEAEIVLHHHERIDGNGYPNGITDINFFVQMLSVADVFDAMTSNRPYKKAICKKDVLLYMYSECGKSFSIESVGLLHKCLINNRVIKLNENI